MEKYFIITVDTEGDNLWHHKKGNAITTQNAKYIGPFQSLCESHGFKPVYFTNYEMAMCDEVTETAKSWQDAGKCEIGVHLHAWNNPPFYELKGKYKGQSYLIEYPENVMRDKFQVIYDLLTTKFQCKPVSHRAGRWAMNDVYFKILEDFNIKVDASVTPYVNWSHSKGVTMGGSNYKDSPVQPHYIGKILEVPVSIRLTRTPKDHSVFSLIRSGLKRRKIWLRPTKMSLSDLKQVIELIDSESDTDYLEFMIHSSELMLGGCPFFKNQRQVDDFHLRIESVFEQVKAKGYRGVTLKEYFDIFKENKK